MEKEGGNRERIRKCRESISLHFLIFSPFPHSLSISSPFPLHFLILSSFPRSPAARLQRFVQPCQTLTKDQKLSMDCDDNFHDFRHIHRQGFNFFQMASFLAVGLMGTKVLLIVLRL